MKQFFKFMFASILGFLLTIFLLFLIGGGILASLASSADQSAEPEIKENSILHIELKNEINRRLLESLDELEKVITEIQTTVEET